MRINKEKVTKEYAKKANLHLLHKELLIFLADEMNRYKDPTEIAEHFGYERSRVVGALRDLREQELIIH